MLHRLALWGALISAAPLVNAAPPPAEAFGHVPRVMNVEINSTGTLLAWTDTSTEPAKIVIHDLATKRPIRTVPVPEKFTATGLHWADDDTLLFEVGYVRKLGFRETDRRGMARWFAIETDGKPARMLLMKDFDREWVSGAEVHATSKKPNSVVMSTYDYSLGRSSWTWNLYEVDTDTGKGTVTNLGSPLTVQWFTDSAGKAVARADWDVKKNTLKLFRIDGSASKEIFVQAEASRLDGWAFDEQLKAVVLVGARGGPNAKVWNVMLDGTPPSVRFEEPGVDVEGLFIDSYTGAVDGALLGGATASVKWLDEKLRARHAALSRSFPDREIELGGHSLDSTKMIVDTSSPQHAPVTYLIDFSAKKADIIGEWYPALEGAALGSVEAITYEARDGTQISAYLTLPPGTARENLPLVVFPHSAPGSRNYLYFDWAAQFFATRGYAVVQPQFRGSSGFGTAHRLAGYRQWGLLMQDDITDSVSAMIAKKIADPGRVCIVGIAFGGYAALAGVAFTPDLYACAASINAPADLPEMVAFVARDLGEDSSALALWQEYVGAARDRQMAERSPRRAIANIRAPVLLLHGAQNTTVPPSQPESMARAMKAQGKQVTFTKIEGDDPWLAKSSTRIQILKELETFLAQHLGPIKQ